MGVLKTILIVLLVLLALFVSCTMLVATGIEEVSKEMEETEKELAVKYDLVAKGMHKTKVEEAIGKPDDVQKMDFEGYESECWYYSFALQICFDGSDRVSSKANY